MKTVLKLDAKDIKIAIAEYVGRITSRHFNEVKVDLELTKSIDDRTGDETLNVTASADTGN